MNLDRDPLVPDSPLRSDQELVSRYGCWRMTMSAAGPLGRSVVRGPWAKRPRLGA